MRIRRKYRIILENIMLIVFIIAPMGWFAVFGSEVGQMWTDLTRFQYEGQWDPDSEFIPGNYSLFSDMVKVYDSQFEKYHLPLNFTTETIFADENCTNVYSYVYSDNGALWTGIAMAAWVFHYLTALKEGNQSDAAYALNVIKRMVSGMSMMLIVPNGGLGPDYPGILARGWAGPQHKDIAPLFFSESTRHFNGTGAYSQYRWRGFTSNDEFGGFYMGLALALKYVDDPWVQDTIGKMVLQLTHYMLETNFLGINGPGGPTGVNQKPRFGGGGFWAPLLLKMASMVDPEKYTRIYYHWAVSEYGFLSSFESHDGETLANYYAYNFAHCVVLAFLLLEGTQSSLGRVYLNGYLNSLRKYTSNHRNAWFNAVYLMVTNQTRETPENAYIIRDIEDQLMRMYINHFPDRYYPLVPVDKDEETVVLVNQIEEKIVQDNWSGLYEIPFVEMDLNDIYFKRAQTVEHHRTGYFMWQDNPFKNESYPEWSWPTLEAPGLSFTVPYWMMRYMGLFPAEGLRII